MRKKENQFHYPRSSDKRAQSEIKSQCTKASIKEYIQRKKIYADIRPLTQS